MLSLKDRCISAATNKPYVKSIVGGLDNSPEGNQVRKPLRAERIAELALLIKYLISRLTQLMASLSSSRVRKTVTTTYSKIQHT